VAPTLGFAAITYPIHRSVEEVVVPRRMNPRGGLCGGHVFAKTGGDGGHGGHVPGRRLSSICRCAHKCPNRGADVVRECRPRGDEHGQLRIGYCSRCCSVRIGRGGSACGYGGCVMVPSASGAEGYRFNSCRAYSKTPGKPGGFHFRRDTSHIARTKLRTTLHPDHSTAVALGTRSRAPTCGGGRGAHCFLETTACPSWRPLPTVFVEATPRTRTEYERQSKAEPAPAQALPPDTPSAIPCSPYLPPGSRLSRLHGVLGLG